MTIRVDAPPVEDEEAALFLMLYHLRMAAMYFEATPLVGRPSDPKEFSLPAMQAWFDEMNNLYPEGD